MSTICLSRNAIRAAKRVHLHPMRPGQPRRILVAAILLAALVLAHCMRVTWLDVSIGRSQFVIGSWDWRIVVAFAQSSDANPPRVRPASLARTMSAGGWLNALIMNWLPSYRTTTLAPPYGFLPLVPTAWTTMQIVWPAGASVVGAMLLAGVIVARKRRTNCRGFDVHRGEAAERPSGKGPHF